jgi:hypothetical protein
VNVLCCLISTAAMLQQAARERVDRWKRTEGRPHGFPHSHACRHSSTAHDLQIIKVHTFTFNIIRAKLCRKSPINAYLRRCFRCGSGSDPQLFGVYRIRVKKQIRPNKPKNCTIYVILEFNKDNLSCGTKLL